MHCSTNHTMRKTRLATYTSLCYKQRTALLQAIHCNSYNVLAELAAPTGAGQPSVSFPTEIRKW